MKKHLIIVISLSSVIIVVSILVCYKYLVTEWYYPEPSNWFPPLVHGKHGYLASVEENILGGLDWDLWVPRICGNLPKDWELSIVRCEDGYCVPKTEELVVFAWPRYGWKISDGGIVRCGERYYAPEGIMVVSGEYEILRVSGRTRYMVVCRPKK